MVVDCQAVWREVSNYLDGEVDPALGAAMEDHLRECKRCAAVVDGMRNVIRLYGDERMFEVPFGFSQRLHRRLEDSMPRSRGTFWGWMVAAAAAALIIGSFEVGNSAVFIRPAMRSAHAEPAAVAVPDDMMVVVSDDGKLFHVAGCKFIHQKSKLRTIPAAEAIREGYAPCVRCMRKYLTASARSPEDFDNEDDAEADLAR